MIYTLNLLNDQEIEKINDHYNKAEFDAGKMNATEVVSHIKNNNEMIRDAGYFLKCEEIVTNAIKKSFEFLEYTSLRKYGPILFSEYQEGMFYHTHNDFYKMQSVRTDYSCTLFLSNKEDYEGGELMLDIGDREIPYKLNAGEVVVYPTGFTHRVNKVASGKRRVCVFWVESTLQNISLRQMNSDMFSILKDYGEKWKYEDRELYDRFVKIKFNLQRNFGHFEGMNK
jgi:PKHD-type hydroxylase